MKTAIGIDPGIGNTGYACVKRHASGYTLIDSGAITTSTKDPLGRRLHHHYCNFYWLLRDHRPDIFSIEMVFHNRNISSSISTASVIAVAELAGVMQCVPAIQVKPQDVKSAVTGRGTASKEHVKRMVNRILSADIRNHHEADAAAVAIAALLKGTSEC